MSKRNQTEVTPEILKKLLSYDPKTGELLWKRRDVSGFATPGLGRHWNKRFAGKAALNCLEKDGYKCGVVLGKPVLAHRVAWAIHHGEWPEHQIDHINRSKGDNRIENLRAVSGLQNMRNLPLPKSNKSGVCGVMRIPNKRRWVARIRHKRKMLHLGTFKTLEEAAAARRAAEKKYGFHPNHGKRVNNDAD